ncbi:hypothetical protein BH11MYX2_BH11MYX2_13250 [soil metagenome]
MPARRFALELLRGRCDGEMSDYTPSIVDAEFEQDLFLALAEGRGLILVTGPTGQGKTTAIQRALADARCPRDVAFVGDIRGDVTDVHRAMQLARDRPVVAVMRSGEGAGVFARLMDMGVPARELADHVSTLFRLRLVRRTESERVLIHERLVVTDAISELIRASADPVVVQRQARADGMRTIREVGMAYVQAGVLAEIDVTYMTPGDLW